MQTIQRGHQTPIEIAELAISKMHSEGHQSEFNIARAVIAALEEAGWKLIDEPKGISTDWTKEDVELEGALCNFCNGASDPCAPTEWAEETQRNFIQLCNAYNDWYSSKKPMPSLVTMTAAPTFTPPAEGPDTQ